MTEPSLNHVSEIRAKIRTVHIELVSMSRLRRLAVDPRRTSEFRQRGHAHTAGQLGHRAKLISPRLATQLELDGEVIP